MTKRPESRNGIRNLTSPSNAFSLSDFVRKCSFLCDSVGRRQAVGASVTRTPTDPGGDLDRLGQACSHVGLLVAPRSRSPRHRPRLRRTAAGRRGGQARPDRRRLRPGPRPSSAASTPAGRTSRTCPMTTSHAMLRAGFLATDTEDAVGWPAAIVICVPTPLTDGRRPDLGAVRSRPRRSAGHLRPGALVVLESTTYPGTTEEVVRPLLEKGSGLTAGMDFHLAFSPERIDPGNPDYGIRNTPKVVGGVTPVVHRRRRGLLRPVRRQVVPGRRHPRGGDGQAAREHLPARQHRPGQRDGDVLPRARRRPVGRRSGARRPSRSASRPFFPGPGVGGHCIPIDPNYLSYKVRRARLPVPVRRAGPGDQRRDARRTSCPGSGAAQQARQAAERRRGCCCSA